jgi:hypothetical protein
MMNHTFIEVKNRSEFKLTPQNPKGKIHEYYGIISFYKARNVFVFKKFHTEGFINQYVLNDSLSFKKTLIFEWENIENFASEGKARFTINVISGSEIETLFDVGFPGKEMSYFGSNQQKKQ